MRRHIATLLIALSSLANATESVETKLIALLHAKLGLSVQVAAEGFFGLKGERYIAALVAAKSDENSVKLALFRKVGETPKSVAQTPSFETSRLGWLPIFKRGTLLLHGDTSCGAVCHISTAYKFQFRDGEYRLIGVDKSSISSDPHVKSGVEDKVFLVTTTKSINLLTMKVQHSREQCLSSDDNPWYCTAKKKMVTKDFSFTSDVKWTLENFSPDIFSEFEDKTPCLRGSIDASFRYRAP